MVKTLEELVSQIKDKLDIVDVVSQQVILKKNGGHYWGLCPFHKEKTPSFSVNPSLGIYKCFGCGEGGDAISFIMKTQNKDFMQVISELAEKLGLEMPSKFQKSDNKGSSGGNKNREERQRAQEIFEKFKKGGKVSTEEILLLQKYNIG